MSVVVLMIVLAASPADRARELYRAGSEAYRQGQYDVAVNAFEEVLAIERRPSVLFSAAQAHRLQYFVDQEDVHLERAVELYRAYLDASPKGSRRSHAVQHLATLAPMLERNATDAPAEVVAEPQARIIVAANVEAATARIDDGEPTPIPAGFIVSPGEHVVRVEAPGFVAQTLETVAVEDGVVALNPVLEPTPGHVTVRAPEGSRVDVDGRVIGRAPLAEPLALAPGEHVVAVVESGHEPYVRLLKVDRGASTEVEAELSVAPMRIGAWVAAGASAVALTAGAITMRAAFAAQADASAYDEKRLGPGLTFAELVAYDAAQSSRDDFVRATIGLGVAGVLAAATAALLWLADDPEPAALLTPGPSSMAISW
ncbi:MAG: PEGA domain-containing protein [Deltaproteobacteria bacterium]|jgi:hypothetical protein